MLSRRSFFSLIAGSIACGAISAPAVSARYRNVSGLRPGRFVWNPSVTAEGPLAIVVSLGERIVHVYRGGAELAFSTIEIAGESAGLASSGIFTISSVGRAEAPGGRSPLVWRGTDLVASGGDAIAATPVVRLPQEFAGLLQQATRNGALVIVTAERGAAQRFEAAGPFANEIETGSVDAPSVARFAKPELAHTAPVEAARRKGQQTTLVVSRADAAAYVLHDGRVAERLAIAIEQPNSPLGLHAAMLLAPARAKGMANWLAFGLGGDASAAHVASDMAQAEMQRVRFLERERVAAVARSLQPGSAMILTDGPGPSATELPRTDVALLIDDTDPAAARVLVPETPTAVRPPVEPARAAPRAKRTAAVERRAANAAKADASNRSRRGSRPMDHREPWPYSMFWPF